MKSNIKLNSLLSIMAMGLTFNSYGADIRIDSSDDLSAEIGTGYNSEGEAFTGKCVSGDTVYVGKQQSNLSFSQSISQKQLSKELGMNAGGRARMGAVTYSASAKFLKNSQSNSFSISSIYTGDYSMKPRVLKDPVLNSIGNKLRNNPERFQKTCGDNFAFKQTLGAKIFFSIRIDFTSEKSKKEFEANFNMSGPVYSASAHLRTAKNKFSKNTKVTVSALQVGGDVSKISDIFKSIDSTGANVGPYNFIKCSLADLVKCETLLTSAIKYATDTESGFPSQITPEMDVNGASGPAILASFAHSYELMGEYINFSAALTRAIKRTRKSLNAKFETVYAQHSMTETLIRSGTVRLSPNQRDRFVEMQAQLYDDLYYIAEGIEDCYKSPLNCNDVLTEISVGSDSEIVHFTEEDFQVSKEVFAQWCDFGYSQFARAQTTKTIEAMVAAAKEIDPDAFTPAAADLEVDVCYVSGKILEKSNTLDISGKGLSDLRVLETLKNITSLDISNNIIEDIGPLKFLKGLIELKANINKIADLSPLLKNHDLTKIHLSDNEISNTSALQRLGGVTYLDLRNNYINVECPYEKPGVCLIADYRYNNDFIPLNRNHTRLPPRWGHQVSKIANGDIVVTGGAVGVDGGNIIDYMQNFNTSFFSAKKTVKQRAFHTATVLDDNSILITGGWGSPRTAEIVKTTTQDYVSAPISGMRFPRVSHRAIKLNNGSVLITGGWKGSNGFWTGRDAQATSELFIPQTGNFSSIGSMRVPRAGHTMTKLQDGRVLITGGYKLDFEGKGFGISSAEIFDPSFNRFVKIPARMRIRRGHHSATLLMDGRVLISGGFSKDSEATNTFEIFDPKTESFHLIKKKMIEARAYHEAVLLPDGKVFLVGGEIFFSAPYTANDTCKTCSKTAEIFDPQAQLSTKTSAEMNVPRSQFSATLTNDNRIIIIGGKGDEARFSASMFEFSKF